MVALLVLGGCAQLPQPSVVGEQERIVIVEPPPPVPNGSIFQPARGYQPLFEDRRPRMIGDILTIVLDEEVSASKNASANAGRSGSAGLDLATLPDALDQALARFSLPPAPRPDPATAGRSTAGPRTPARVVVAFSGGPDSTALLLAWVRHARRRGGPPPVAVHVDHAADPGSRSRARHAARLARRLGVPFVVHRLRPGQAAPAGESAEAAARRHRYRFLLRGATGCGAPWIATAHHRDDQAETVLLRMIAGSGLRGLAAIRPARRLGPPDHPRRPWLVRPLLDLPGATLRAAVASAGLSPARDATNRDLSIPRNRLRHQLLPRLETEATETGEPPLAPRLARLAATARGAFATVDRILARHLGLATAVPSAVPAAEPGGETPWRPPQAPEKASLDLPTLAALPAPLFRHALALLHRAAGSRYPPGREARRQLRRQLAAGDRVGCDAGGGWRWESRGGQRLALTRAAAPGDSPSGGFSYILEVPGEVEIGEIGSVLRLYRAPLAAWMYRGSEHRAGLASDLAPGATVTVRSRRPGDRMRPLGAGGSRRLKDVLIDHRVPRRHRDRLPLVTVGGDIAWVPGITVGEAFRLPAAPGAGATVWVAELVRPGRAGATDDDRPHRRQH